MKKACDTLSPSSISTPILKRNPFNPQKISLVDLRFFTRSFSKPSMLKSKLDVPLRNDSLNFTILLRKSSCVLSVSLCLSVLLSLYVSSLSKPPILETKKCRHTAHTSNLHVSSVSVSLSASSQRLSEAATVLRGDPHLPNPNCPLWTGSFHANLKPTELFFFTSFLRKMEIWPNYNPYKKKLSISAATSGSNCSRASALSFLSFCRQPKVVPVRDDDAKWILEGGGQPGRFRPTANGEHVRDQAANKARGDWGQYWPDITLFS
jgi:hypothetical protein